MFIIWHKSNEIRSNFAVMQKNNTHATKAKYKIQWKMNKANAGKKVQQGKNNSSEHESGLLT